MTNSVTPFLLLSDRALWIRDRRRLRRAFTGPLQDGLPQEIFDLAIDAPQVVLRPPLQLGPEITVNAKEKGLPFSHVE
jgi:hypothetical protein